MTGRIVIRLCYCGVIWAGTALPFSPPGPLSRAEHKLSRAIIHINEIYRNNSPKRHCSLLPTLANPRVRFVRLGNTR